MIQPDLEPGTSHLIGVWRVCCRACSKNPIGSNGMPLTEGSPERFLSLPFGPVWERCQGDVGPHGARFTGGVFGYDR